MADDNNSKSGPGCLWTTIGWIILLGLVGWGFYGMEPQDAASWAITSLPYVALAIFGVLGAIVLGALMWH